MKEKIEIDGIPTWARRMTMTERRSKCDRVSICPLCRKEIETDDSVFLLINNYRLFPNILIHEECVKQDLATVIIILKYDYMRAKDSRKHNRCWYDYES